MASSSTLASPSSTSRKAARPAPISARLATRPRGLGGSNAQRDVFVRTLAGIAADRGDAHALERILAVRRRLKRDDRFVAVLRGWLAQARRAGRDGRRHSASLSKAKRSGISAPPLAIAS